MAIFLLSVCAFAQQTVAERLSIQKQGLRKITETRYDYTNGIRNDTGKLYGFITYDSLGNLIATGRYSADGTPYAMYLRSYAGTTPVKRVWHCELNDDYPEGKPCLYFEGYRFDAFGNVSHEYGFNMKGDSVAKVIFQRDSTGRPVNRWDHLYGDAPSVTAYHYQYNKFGDAISMLTTSIEGDTLNLTTYQHLYDPDGKLHSTKTISTEGEKSGKVEFIYDAKGNKTTEIRHDARGRPYQMRQFQYVFYKN